MDSGTLLFAGSTLLDSLPNFRLATLVRGGLRNKNILPFLLPTPPCPVKSVSRFRSGVHGLAFGFLRLFWWAENFHGVTSGLS